MRTRVPPGDQGETTCCLIEECSRDCCLIHNVPVVYRCLGRPQDRHQRRAAPHMIDMHGGKAALVLVCIPERKLLTTMRRAECVVDVEDLLFPRFHGAAELIDKGPVNRAASVLRGAFASREIVDCEASGSPLSGQRPTATFISGSCLNRSKSLPSLLPHVIAAARAMTS